MPAIRITINTDQFGDDWPAARMAVAERLDDLRRLLAQGEYVGRFALGGSWMAVRHDMQPPQVLAACFPSRDAALKYLDDNHDGWTTETHGVQSSRDILYGDIDEL